MKVELSNKNLCIALFLITFISKFFSDVLVVARGGGGLPTYIKYFTMGIFIVFSLAMIGVNKENGSGKVFLTETLSIVEVIVSFVLLSFVLIFIHEEFTSQTMVELFYLAMAILFGYTALNVFDFKDIMFCMKILLVFAMIAYALEIGTGNFTLSNLSLVSFTDSSSPFESSYSASISIILLAFFAYYRNNKFWTILAAVFCFATFKRLNIVFLVILLVYPIFVNVDKPVNKKVAFLCKIVFVVGTLVLYYLYKSGDDSFFYSLFGMDATKFSTGRNLYLQSLLNSDFRSLGYGSSTAALGYNLEMDFIKIYLELTVVGLYIFISKYYDISVKNNYCFIFMTMNMLNFLTSHSLSSPFNWALRFILIGCITYKQYDDIEEASRYHNFKIKKPTKTVMIIRGRRLWKR